MLFCKVHMMKTSVMKVVVDLLVLLPTSRHFSQKLKFWKFQLLYAQKIE